jgi:hypothetical protein
VPSHEFEVTLKILPHPPVAITTALALKWTNLPFSRV